MTEGPFTDMLGVQAHVSRLELTEREKECLIGLAHGHRIDRIADNLGIKSVTVQLHIDKAKKKLNATTREQALFIAMQAGLVTP
ncbi:response regulator transcription factor [Pseudomonadota bacterium]